MKHTEEIRAIFKRWQRDLCPGGQVFVAQKGKVIFGECFGYADIERAVAVFEDTVFHVASVSKQITCMSALLLHERGLLNVDDDIRKYIPDLVSFEEPVTVRDMMNNVSGIRDQWELQLYSGVRMNDIITQKDLLAINSRQKSLNFPPRSKYMYSNAGFTYVAEIVSRVSGMSFPEFALENIFKPLGMTHTFIREKYDHMVMNRALSYVDRGDGSFLWKSLNFSNFGATSLHTTAPDFLKWLKNFRDPVICKPETLEIMLTVPKLTTEEQTSYACGVNVDKYNGYDFGGRKLITHSGADAGYRSVVLTFPDDELDIVVFSNTENISPEGAAYQIAALLLEATKAEAEDPTAKLFEETPRVVSDFSGRFIAKEPGLVVNVIQDGEAIIIEYGSKKEHFRQGQGNCYTTAYSDNRLYFREDGAYISLSGSPGHKLEPCQAAAFSEAEKEMLPGIYFSEEVESYFEILEKEDRLFLRHKRFGMEEILQTGEEQYLCPLELSLKFKIVKNDAGKICGIAVSGGRVTEIVFHKVKFQYLD